MKGEKIYSNKPIRSNPYERETEFTNFMKSTLELMIILKYKKQKHKQ